MFSISVLSYLMMQLAGSDIDEYGCITSAGYTWCETLGECIRQWITECPPSH